MDNFVTTLNSERGIRYAGTIL